MDSLSNVRCFLRPCCTFPLHVTAVEQMQLATPVTILPEPLLHGSGESDPSGGACCAQAAPADAAAARPNGAASTSAPAVGQVSVVYCYRVPTSLRPVMGDVSSAKDDLYTEAQVHDALRCYAEHSGLRVSSLSRHHAGELHRPA